VAIDIKDGDQRECVACAACIDACRLATAPFGIAPFVAYPGRNRDPGKAGAAVKALIAGILRVFLLLLAATVYVAAVSDEGLVEDGYYDRARLYVADKELEQSSAHHPGPRRLEAGRNRLTAVVATSSAPLRGAVAAVDAMRLSGPGDDRRSLLREESPGTYAGEIVLPGAGQWLLRLTVDSGPLRAQRRWIAMAAPASPAGGGGGPAPRGRAPGRDIHAGPVAGIAGGQARDPRDPPEAGPHDAGARLRGGASRIRRARGDAPDRARDARDADAAEPRGPPEGRGREVPGKGNDRPVRDREADMVGDGDPPGRGPGGLHVRCG